MLQTKSHNTDAHSLTSFLQQQSGPYLSQRVTASLEDEYLEKCYYKGSKNATLQLKIKSYLEKLSIKTRSAGNNKIKMYGLITNNSNSIHEWKRGITTWILTSQKIKKNCLCTKLTL